MKRSIRVIKVRDLVEGDEILSVYTATGWNDAKSTSRLHPESTIKALLRG